MAALAVFRAGHTVQEGYPEGNAGLCQLGALLQNVTGMVAFMDTVQCSVVPAFHTHEDFLKLHVFKISELFHCFVPDICYACVA